MSSILGFSTEQGTDDLVTAGVIAKAQATGATTSRPFTTEPVGRGIARYCTRARAPAAAEAPSFPDSDRSGNSAADDQPADMTYGMSRLPSHRMRSPVRSHYRPRR